MKKVLLIAACAVLATGVAANAGNVALSLVNSAGASADTAAAGTYTLEVRATAELGGLALFGFDFEAPAGVPLVSDQFDAAIANFEKTAGLTNPAGFGGTLSGGVLLQVGGGQNTINYTGTTPNYPTGTVLTGVGVPGPTTLASIVLDTSALTAGVYVFQISNGFANLIDPAGQAGPVYTVSAATMLAGSPTFTLTISGGGDITPPKLVSAQSMKTHGVTLGELGISIPLGLQANNRHIIEPRQGSVTKLVLTFDEPLDPLTFVPANISVIGLNSTPGAPATATLDGTGMIGTVTYADLAIPNGQLNNSAGDCYRLQLGAGITDVAGNPIDVTADKIYFAASFGNVASGGVLNNWKKVNSTDRSQVVLNITNTPTPAQAIANDVWIQGIQAGRINATDVSNVVLSISATDLDNLVLP